MPIDWVTMAILSTVVLGAVNIIDSHLISKRMPSLQAFLLAAGIGSLVYGLIFLRFFPLQTGVGTWPLVLSVVSAIARTVSVLIVFYTLRIEEVSRVIPMASTYPIFVAIIAIPLLGETLGFLEWIAIIIVAAGGVIVSIKQSPGGSTTWLGKAFFLLIASSLLMAGANVASKYALTYISFLNMYFITVLCMAGIFMLVSFRPRVFKELLSMRQRNSAIALLLLDESLVVIGIVAMFWAMETGPVSLVSAIASSRPIFVLIYALILSRTLPMFLEWQSGKLMLAIRVVAAVLIVGGISIIYLS
jgi:uncharacterized membrane protein